jgi:ubiquinone/menaquinone biosynthesis C-methylase UbiE
LRPSDAARSLELPTQRKRDLVDHFESNVDELERWRKFNAAYHEDDFKFMRFLIPPGKRVLELGCGRGDLLAALEPSYGVGVDFGARTVAKANELHPTLNFVLGDVEDPDTLSSIEGPFDYIVIADTIGMFEDIDATLRLVHHLCAPSTRIIISYYSHLWEPILKAAELLRLRAKQPTINYIATADFLNLMDLADFEVIGQEQRQLLPRHWLGLGPFINRFIAPLPGIRNLCLRTYLVGRPVRLFPERKFSASILIPCRTRAAISRMRSGACRDLAPRRKSCSSKATQATAPSPNASACATPTKRVGTSRFSSRMARARVTPCARALPPPPATS